MKALITGATGQVGRALLALAPEGAQVTALGRCQLDLTDSAAIEETIAVLQPDIVLNAAAYTSVDRAESEEAMAQAINADAVGMIVAALDRHGGRLAHISTDFVFDGARASAWRPADKRNPLSVYGRSKAAGEDYLREQDLLLRTSWVHAAGGVNFVRTMLRLMRERDRLTVVNDQIGAPTWASALADVLWRSVQRGVSGTYHYSDAGIASWYDFAVAIGEEAQLLGLLEKNVTILPVGSQDYPVPATRPAFSVLDSRSTHEVLSLTPVHWRSNLRRMLAEEKAHG
ncbi:dTDP-4-dehydrorhamnose reductase [Aurantiacibacter spongiae]|uniref:dTDP-4-dehydrorhamnose reductase n=1 Tax=Aurantiacibacter spongiae TaxID=2488860 RepID=A0A3N5CTA4_9SPHN|nr:dTDP-4-dehydrorhamnose reductase [Aurantiacibacter spongiae]RPF71526.1 dTDP-4-dehydrorhamnose reductase [Aurantiacibacter spongiae]